MTLVIEFKFPEWAELIKRNEDRINLFQAAQIQFNRAMIFDNEGAWNGRKRWAPLRFRNGQILTKTGTLRKSIGPTNGGGMAGPDGIVRILEDQIIVGTKLGYARLMNDGTTKMPGGVMRPTKAKALKIPLPQGASANKASRKLGGASLNKALASARQQLKAKGKGKGGDKIRERIQKIELRLTKLDQKGTGGDKFIFRRSVRIPARPFDDWTEDDQAEFDQSILNLIGDILNGKN